MDKNQEPEDKTTKPAQLPASEHELMCAERVKGCLQSITSNYIRFEPEPANPGLEEAVVISKAAFDGVIVSAQLYHDIQAEEVRSPCGSEMGELRRNTRILAADLQSLKDATAADRQELESLRAKEDEAKSALQAMAACKASLEQKDDALYDLDKENQDLNARLQAAKDQIEQMKIQTAMHAGMCSALRQALEIVTVSSNTARGADPSKTSDNTLVDTLNQTLAKFAKAQAAE